MVTLKLRSSHWIVDQQNNIVFGNGRMRILKSIEKTGSINQTAKALKMSYKTVWSKIKSTEKNLKTKVVHSSKQEGTCLTAAGRELMEKFEQMSRQCIQEDDRIFDGIFSR